MELKKNKSEIHFKEILKKNQHKEQMNTLEMQITQGKNCLCVEALFFFNVYFYMISR